MPPGDLPDHLPDDLQRPLDESVPLPAPPAETEPEIAPTEAAAATAEAAPAPAEAGTAVEVGPLRPAVPAELEGTAGIRSHVRRERVWAMLGRAAATPVRLVRRASRAALTWSRGPSGRFVAPGLLIVALVGGAGAAGSVLVPAMGVAGDEAAGPASPGATPATPLPTPGPGAVAPQPGAIAPPGADLGAGGARADALAGWAADLSGPTGIPVVALQAYGYAELVVTRTRPGCQLSWTTLAAIGRVESNHGSSGGAQLLPDGRALPPIIGAALDGTGDRLLIRDTDGGELDGDDEYDRAVGPMQFIPQTWRQQAVDATGDGIADIHNINDAALAAANYLCGGGRDLGTADGWWGAVLSYNNVQAYADAVYAAANEYGLRSRT